ncbi:MAG: divergent polysaccharide deacetylase family protein, partial [Magnetovibrio sp.]|nr:divergent polysaccharide deacetylase family protein [Magnetovibrio sp.]
VSRAATEAAIRGLPSEVSFSLNVYARGLDFWMKKMRSSGHEVLLEMPSEPANFPFDDPGPAALRALAPLQENIQKLEFILSRTSGYFGVISIYGGKFLKVEDQVRGVLEQLNRRGLMYVDGGAVGSQGTRVAYKQKMPWASVELNLDEVLGKAALLRQLKELEALAEKRSMTMARITATPLSLKLLSNWIQELPSKRMRLVPVSALANKQLIR